MVRPDASFCVLGLDALRPDLGVAMEMRQFVTEAEFSRTLLEEMLGLRNMKPPRAG